MRIENVKQLERWDLQWPLDDPGPWVLDVSSLDQAFAKNLDARGVYWISDRKSDLETAATAKYCGKAVLQPLRRRLKQHALGSHNIHVRTCLQQRKRLWFRYVEFANTALAEFTEGTMISAFREEYVWNGRNEFLQQWALEVL